MVDFSGVPVSVTVDKTVVTLGENFTYCIDVLSPCHGINLQLRWMGNMQYEYGDVEVVNCVASGSTSIQNCAIRYNGGGYIDLGAINADFETYAEENKFELFDPSLIHIELTLKSSYTGIINPTPYLNSLNTVISVDLPSGIYDTLEFYSNSTMRLVDGSLTLPPVIIQSDRVVERNTAETKTQTDKKFNLINPTLRAVSGPEIVAL